MDIKSKPLIIALAIAAALVLLTAIGVIITTPSTQTPNQTISR